MQYGRCKLKLALVIAALTRGGAERVMVLLANYWAARGHDIALITVEARLPEEYPLDARVRRVPLSLFKDSNGFIDGLRNNWKRIRALRAVFRSTAPAVVISFEDETNVLVMLAT